MDRSALHLRTKPSLAFTFSCSSCFAPKRLVLLFWKVPKGRRRKVSRSGWVKAVGGGGGLGMAAVMSATATAARLKLTPVVSQLAANPTFVAAAAAWAAAQWAKVVLSFVVERKWDPGLMFSCGGMPSSHSAMCTALSTSVALCHGIADSLFPVCLGFTLIVMYDATGVRRHAGMQAQVLNMIVEDLFQGHPISQRKLKELLGHTPSQVIAGALLGIAVAFMCCNGCLVAT